MFREDLLKSDRIRITALKEEDIETITKWYEDTNFLRVFDFNPSAPKTVWKIREWLMEEVSEF